MASWPTTLPQCALVTPRSEKRKENRITTEMETGAPKRRKRFTAVPTYFELNFVMTSDQYDTLMQFYDDYIEFDWEHPRTKDPITCCIAETPSCDKVGVDSYKVKFTLEVKAS